MQNNDLPNLTNGDFPGRKATLNEQRVNPWWHGGCSVYVYILEYNLAQKGGSTGI